jgi:hypothetical protein
MLPWHLAIFTSNLEKSIQYEILEIPSDEEVFISLPLLNNKRILK